jgi:hypothetical protein
MICFKRLLTLGSAALMSGVSLLSAIALAQTSPGTKLEVVMRSGDQHKVFTYGWQGISATAVFGQLPERYKRPDVRIVCAGECSIKLPAGDVSVDTITWRTGQPTTGPVTGVFCTEYDECSVRQGDRPRDWFEVRFIQFAPR